MAISSLQNAVDTELLNQINTIIGLCDKLSDQNVWDGQLAGQFRSEVNPKVKSALKNAHQELSELQKNLSKITQNIMTAGGNS
ncbi:MAG TPA: hypothetical protein VK364_00205 [Hymenobacter sp.]|nr:hypothetical protein [Hymenobacter sp.]